MNEPTIPYDLPEHATSKLLTLAAESDLLLVGEVHGTQEVPRAILSLLPALAALGCNGLGLEIPANQRDQLPHYAQGEGEPPSFFGPSGFRDGRDNAQVLSLVEQAQRAGWGLLCFDVAFIQEGDAWSVRDRGMAQNLLDQWERHVPGRKVLGICGNYHSRLVPPTEPNEFWPSFAAASAQLRPDLAVRSVNVTFGRGAFFNGEVRTFDMSSEHFASQAEVRALSRAGHTVDLYLPHATPATFADDADG